MSNWLAYIGSAIVAILAALFAVPAMIDWNGYRGVFEEEATRVLGRDVRLGGNVNLRLLPAPYVSFERMRISDPDSQTGDPLFRAESFTMWLALSPLMRGALQANQVELKNPVLKLAVASDGTGNWSRLHLAPGALPFVPADVALNSVKVSNGEIGLVGPEGAELAKVDAVNGELTADALTGPIRFRGRVNWSGEPREVRFASSTPEANGDVRFKLAATGTVSHSSYVVDGRVTGLGGQVAVDGEMTAKIAPDLSTTNATAQPGAGPAALPQVPELNFKQGEEKVEAPTPAAAASGAPVYELRSKIAGSATGFNLSDISITSQSGPPQLVTGKAQVAWGPRTRVDLALNSRWIDLDAMFGTGKTVVPLEAARGLFEVLMRQLPASSDTNINLAVDQLNLGSDQISNVRFAAVRAGGPLEVRDFQVDLPGATHLSLGGQLAPGETSPKFEGNIGLKGQSLARFLAWGTKQGALTQNVSDGPFALNGNLKFSGKLIELSDAKVGIGDTPVTASVRLDFAERRRLALKLEGQKIDIGRIWPGGLQMETLAPLIVKASTAAKDAGEGSKDTPPPAEASWFDLSVADIALGIRAGALVDGPRTLRNVEADVSVDGGKLAMRALKFADDAGLEVELEGEAEDLRSAAQGGVRGLIVAPSADAAAAFVDISGLDSHVPELQTYLKRMAPLRLAVTVALGGRTGTATDLKIDGTVRGGRLIASADLDGGLPAWRTSPVNISARIEANDVEEATTAVLGLPPRSNGQAGRILARATGTPQDGLLAFAAIQSEALKLDYTGRLLMPSGAPIGLAGEAKVAGQDATTLLSMAGLDLPDAAAAVPINGALSIASEGDKLTLRPDKLVVAGTSLSGTVSLTRPVAGSTTVDAKLESGDVTLNGLLLALLDGRKEPLPPEPEPARGRTAPAPMPVVEPIWPEQPFDLSAFDRLTGTVTLHATKLAVQPGLGIADARMDLTLEPGRLTVTKLSGNALGGKLVSSMVFAKQAAGIGLDGKLELRVAQGEVKPDAVAWTQPFAGRALSPAALIADLKGTGELRLADVTVGGMNPSLVGEISEAALNGRGPQSGEPLMTALRDGLRQGQIKLGEMAVPVTLGEGNLKLAKIELKKSEGLTTLETVVELATLKLDSEWSVEARLPDSAGAAAGKMLPPVSVIYAGALQDVASIEPQISVASLERELTVRKMERDVEQLERLRKEDEKRAAEEKARIRAEQERVRQEKLRLEAERAAAAAAAAAVDDPQPAADPAAGSGVPAAGSVPAAGADPAGAGAAGSEPTPMPPPDASSAPATPDGANTQAADGTTSIPSSAPADARPAPRPAPARRRPPEENWNPFTQF
jgi:uncharacterized protein involved in outer membrane biogenesis